MKRWAAAVVRTDHEKQVADRLDQHGVASYFPTFTQPVRPAKKRKPTEVERAAFPGYLFVDWETVTDPDTLYQDSRLHYVIYGPDDRVALIHSDIIDEIRTRAALGAYEPRFGSGPQFAKGEIVKVPTGPYKSYRGMVTNVRRGYYELSNLDFTKAIWFSGLLLLGNSV